MVLHPPPLPTPGSRYAYLFAAACARHIWLARFATFPLYPSIHSEQRGKVTPQAFADYTSSTRTTLPPGAVLLRQMFSVGGALPARDRVAIAVGMPPHALPALSRVFDESLYM